MKIIILVLIKFFLISALFISSNGNLKLNDPEQREIFFNLYTNWFEKTFNQGAELVGYVINSEWLPKTYPKNPA